MRASVRLGRESTHQRCLPSRQSRSLWTDAWEDGVGLGSRYMFFLLSLVASLAWLMLHASNSLSLSAAFRRTWVVQSGFVGRHSREESGIVQCLPIGNVSRRRLWKPSKARCTGTCILPPKHTRPTVASAQCQQEMAVVLMIGPTRRNHSMTHKHSYSRFPPSSFISLEAQSSQNTD